MKKTIITTIATVIATFPAHAVDFYVVREGDTIFSIAGRISAANRPLIIKCIKDNNNMGHSSLIYPGDKLIVPDSPGECVNRFAPQGFNLNTKRVTYPQHYGQSRKPVRAKSMPEKPIPAKDDGKVYAFFSDEPVKEHKPDTPPGFVSPRSEEFQPSPFPNYAATMEYGYCIQELVDYNNGFIKRNYVKCDKGSTNRSQGAGSYNNKSGIHAKSANPNRYKISQDLTLSQNLDKWMESSEGKLVWNSNKDLTVESSVDFGGDFDKAIEALAKYAVGVRITYYKKSSTLVVSDI